MNKKLILLFLGIVVCGAALKAQTLDEAILNTALTMGRDLPASASAAVISFSSDSEKLNDYVLNELYGAILRNGKIKPVKPNQGQLQNIQGELNRETAQNIGRLLGVQYIITGSLEQIGSGHRIQFTTVDMDVKVKSEYSTVLSSVGDRQFASLLGGKYVESSKDYLIPISAGGGLLLVPGFSVTKYEYYDYHIYEFKQADERANSFGIGVNGFFDATYIEINVGLLFTNSKTDVSGAKAIDTTDLTLGFIGKFPISIGEKAKFFPFAGIEYNLILAEEFDGEDMLKNVSSSDKADSMQNLKILLGAGFDFDINDGMYFRAEASYGIFIDNKGDKDFKDSDSDNKLIRGIIPIKLGVGFRF